MNQIYYDASEAMKAAYELSQRLHKPVYRHVCLDDRGATVWLVTTEKDVDTALQEFSA
ncbi:hypothetical protein HX799_01225 [Pseudomonas tolaasii]|uniref:hypothetical protein n=1 Tax=Pseudomonas tolaasii TaxID=29442 RepID=UPI0015A070F0|nr:hypothetical protein [Pseudomonas tolaasii]NWC26362.1 hypothetical protein [Pseudomonas tolaasii]NWC49778.1 hypothetical protein [Pseudomonas tolaasii]NWE63710.1 hypothetical protein [Pseudomonas tolaasii]